MVKIFNRELAAWLAVVAAVFGVVTSYGFDVSGHVQGIVTAVVVFVFAVTVAVRSGDGIVALVTGAATALFSLFSAFNLDVSAQHQGLWIGALTVVVGFFTRSQVTSPVTAGVSPPGKLVA